MSNKLRNIITTVMLIVIVYIIYTITYTAAYSVLSADDFGFIYESREIAGTSIGNRIAFGWTQMLEFNKTWQGTYFTNFLVYFFATWLAGTKCFWILRLLLIGASLLFFVAVLVFVNILLENMFNVKDKRFVVITYGFALLLLFSYTWYEEIFNWYVGVCAYTIPIAIVFLALSLMIKASYSDKKIYMILACILIIPADGGTLAISGLMCWCAALLMYINHSKKSIVLFVESVLFAVLNVIQPGNWVRGELSGGTSFNILEAVKNTLLMVIERNDVFWGSQDNNSNIVFYGVCIIAIVLLFSKTMKFIENTVNIVIGICLLPFVVTFPIALGNNRFLMSNRYMFVIDAALVISYLALFFAIGMYIKCKFYDKKELPLLIVLVAITATGLDGYSASDTVLFQVSEQIIDDEYVAYYNQCMNLFDILESSTGDIMVTAGDYPAEIQHMKPFELDIDATNWINNSIANYFGLNSIYLGL